MINELQQRNNRLAQEISEQQGRATAELQHRQRAEEEASRLKDANKKLQRQVKNRAITALYFNPRLETILHVVAELREGMPLECPNMLLGQALN